MMITCQKCGVRYARSMARCIACGTEYQPTPEEAEKVLIDDVLTDFSRGHKRTEVFANLVNGGVGEDLAEHIVATAMSQYREKVKRKGSQLAWTGSVLLGSSVLICMLPLFGFHLLWLGAAVSGFALLVTGSLMVWTGRDFAGPTWD